MKIVYPRGAVSFSRPEKEGRNMEENKNLTLPAEVLPAAKLEQFLQIANVGQNLPANKRQQFIEIAQAYGLNPFKREIYCVGYGDRTSIITGYEVYIKRAERSGLLNGWEVEIGGKMPEITATIRIWRKDWDKPFTHTVYFEEAAQYTKDNKLNSVWSKMPRFMLRKVAIAQGFRLCFSDELGGMPYTADELPEAEKQPATIIAAPQAVEAEVVKSFGDKEFATIESCGTEEELKKICNALLKKFPAAKKELVKAFNKRLAEILKGAKND